MTAPQGRRGPARGRVQKQRNNLSARRSDTSLKVALEPNKWQRLDWLRVNSARHGQRLCGLSAACDEVTVQRSAKGGVNFGGLLKCNSRTCPTCGPKIAATTRDEIEQAIAAWMIADYRRLWFGTFTIRHARGQSFQELAAAVSAAWQSAIGGRGWIADRMQHGVEHTLRITEQKWSQANGWHIHIHVLFFIDERFSAAKSHDALLATMFKRWASKAVSLGMGVPLIRAQDLHQVDGASALERVAGYFAKQTTDAGDAHPRSIAAEMSNSAGKTGLTSLTPGQILAWAMQGEDYIAQLWGPARARAKGRGLQGQEYARHLYNEFELGMKGKRAIAWSRGMREALGLGRELTEEEAADRAEAAETAAADTLVSMSGRDWSILNRRPGRRADLYAVAATLDPAELVAWLAGYGVHAVPHRKNREGDSIYPRFEFDGSTPF